MDTRQRFKRDVSWILVTAFLLHLTALADGQVQSDVCPENCVNRTCKDPANGRLRCSYGCKDGHWGGACKNDCPSNCISCNRFQSETVECYGCQEGYYLTDTYKECTLQCPTGCSTCSSYTDCTACNTGYFKFNTECRPCPSSCTKCTSESTCTECKSGFTGDACENCIDGKYIFESQCLDCLAKCQTCTSYSVCQVCQPDYYNSNSVTDCSLTTPPCPSNCATCASENECLTCDDGFYNTNTAKDCSNTCPGRCMVCSSDSSCSQCKTNYDGTACENCAAGKVGDNCDQNCPDNCESCSSTSDCNTCRNGYFKSASTSKCSPCPDNCATCLNSTSCDSCNPHFKGRTCELCTDGRYGTNCNTPCSNNCLNSICHRDAGYCLQCRSGYTGNECEQCEDGKHGEDCDQFCSSNCMNTKCERYSAQCTSGCINQNFNDAKCEKCKNGFYGADCTDQCPDNCNSNICVQSNGKCTHGCQGGFSGDSCDQCSAGKHGEACNKDCSMFCDTTACERNDGTCSPCKPGYYGDNCTLVCSPNCKDSACNQLNGNCLNGCNSDYSGDKCCIQSGSCDVCYSIEVCQSCLKGFYGGKCDILCADNCDETGCDKSDGRCTGGCVAGFYGEFCNQTCSGNCNNNACNKQGKACLQGCLSGYEGPRCSEAITEKESTPPLAAIIGGVAGGLAAIVVIVVIVIMIKRRNRHGKDDFVSDHRALPPEIPKETSSERRNGSNKARVPSRVVQENDEIDAVDDDENVLDGIDDDDDNQKYLNIGDVRKRIAVTELEGYISGKASKDLLEDYKLFPRGLLKSYDASRQPENRANNRYASIYPYDENRVKLSGRSTDYINASYIDGYNKNKAYIACLGPTKAAMDHFRMFWDMVWQEEVEKMVMLTNLIENTNMKCEQYWPSANFTMTYGSVTVTNLHEETNAEYTVRNFSVAKGNQKRTVSQVHFTAWPDKGVPDHVTSIVEFHNKVKSLKHEMNGPILVHCSAGIGRTGTYIGLDILTEEGEKTGHVDIFNCVMALRYQRINMVQTPEQYVYLHKAVAHNLTFDSHPISATEFQKVTSETSDKDFEHKFERLKVTMEQTTEEEEKSRRKSRTYNELNRNGTDIPSDRHRPRLYKYQTMGDYDYINAVYIDSFKARNHFIAAQTPLPATVRDFIKLILQEKCSCVVNMEPETLRIKTIGDYIPPDNQTIVQGQFELSSTKLASPDAWSLRKLTIKQVGKDDAKETAVHCYQFNAWPGKENAPKDPVTFLRFIKDVKAKAYGLDDDDKSPILLHCLSGAIKCGLFCAVHNAVEKLESEQEVSIANILRQIKFRRRSAFPHKDQLVFCYKVICGYLDSFNTYSNFELKIYAPRGFGACSKKGHNELGPLLTPCMIVRGD